MDLNKKLTSLFEGRGSKKSGFVLSEVTKISPDSKGHSGEGSMPMAGGGEMGGWTRWENAQNALEKGQAAVQKAMENPEMDDKLRAKLDKVVERMSSASGQLSRQGKLTPEMAKSTMGALSGLAQSGGKSSAALQKAMVGVKNHAGEAGVPSEEMSEYNKIADKYAQQVEKEATPADEPPEDPEKSPTEMPDELEVGDEPEDGAAPDYEGETDQPDPRTTGPEKPVGDALDPGRGYADDEDENKPAPDDGEDPQVADIASKMDDEGEPDVLDPYAGEEDDSKVAPDDEEGEPDVLDPYAGEEDDNKVAPDEEEGEPDVLDPYAGEDEEDDNKVAPDEEDAPDEAPEDEPEEDEPLGLADEKPSDGKETDWENDPRVSDIASQMDDEGEPDVLDPYAGEGEEDDNKVAPDEDEEDAPLELKDEEPSEKPETDWENDPRLAGTGKNFDGQTGERLNTDLAQELAGNKPEMLEPEQPAPVAPPAPAPVAPPAPAPVVPVAAQPAPVAAQPAPVAAQPAPVAAQPAPAPAPVAAQPAPAAAPAPAAPAEPGAAPEAQPAAPAAPPSPAVPPQDADANVEILKQGGDSALVRVRGKENGKAVYKYLIINAADLEKTTQDPTFSPQNVWQHIGASLRDPNYLKNFKNSAQAALADFQHASTEEAPKNADEFIRRAVGKTHRDMLLNAIKRSGNKDLTEIAATLSDTQVAQLLEQYPEVRNADIPDEQVQQYMNTLERQFSPQMESKEFKDVLLEVGFLKRLGGKLKRGARSLQSKMGLDTEMYAKQGLRYDMLAKAMAADPPKMAQALQKIGVDTSQFPQLQGMQPTGEQDALGQPEGADVLDPGDDDMGDLSADLDAEPGSPEDLAAEPETRQSRQPDTRQMASMQAQQTEPTTDRVGAGGDTQQATQAVQAAQPKQTLGQRAMKGARNMVSKGLQKASDWAKPKSEEYARAINKDLRLEEVRLTANDHAQAALKIYTMRCNDLNRTSINEMFSVAHQKLFNQALSESRKNFVAYRILLKKNGLNAAPEVQGGLYESLIQLVYCTADPLSETGQVQLDSDPMVIAEAYHRKNIGNKENKGSYIPLSNIL